MILTHKNLLNLNIADLEQTRDGIVGEFATVSRDVWGVIDEISGDIGREGFGRLFFLEQECIERCDGSELLVGGRNVGGGIGTRESRVL